MSKRPSIDILKRAVPFFAVLLAVSMAAGSPAFAQEKLMETKGPVVITSSTLTADNKARTALFEGSVVAKTESMTIFSKKMLVSYTENGKITKIEATGDVKVMKGDRVITSDEATYFADEEKVVFTGQPKAVEGPNLVTGTKIIYMMKDDRSLVENSKVFMERSPRNR
jgi:lipopolysaccharide export system protein LptA